MKKAMILSVVAALVLALMAGTAIAKPGESKGKGSGKDKAPVTETKGKGKGKGPAAVTYVFKGTVADVTTPTTDPETGETVGSNAITVDVTGGNNATKQLLGSQTFSVDEATKINLDDEEGATLDQIGEGYEIVVQSKAPAGTTSGFVARMISAETPEPVETEPVETEPAA